MVGALSVSCSAGAPPTMDLGRSADGSPSSSDGGLPDVAVDGVDDSSRACTARAMNAGDYADGIEVVTPAGRTRRYFRFHVPASYQQQSPTAVVFVFHDYFWRETVVEAMSGMDRAADDKNVVVVYPRGLDDTWNVGAGCCGFAGFSGADDVAFLRTLIDQLGQRLCIDPRRIFAVGQGNGGMLALRLGCEASDRFAAVAAVGSSRMTPACAPANRRPVMVIHGTDDESTSGEGLTESVPLWVKLNGCTDARPSQLPKGGSAHCEVYSQCAAGALVEHCLVPGSQLWPGGTPRWPADQINPDFDATAELLQFFLAQPMP